MGVPRRLAVLAVCTANICRSPLMEILLHAQLDPRHFEVGSAGVRGWDAKPMDSMAAAELERLGHDAERFRSRRIDSHLVDSADLILTATRAHRSDVLSLNPLALRRSFTLLEFAALAAKVDASDPQSVIGQAARQRGLASGDVDIADPYRRGAAKHRHSADQIAGAAAVISERLNALTVASPPP